MAVVLGGILVVESGNNNTSASPVTDTAAEEASQLQRKDTWSPPLDREYTSKEPARDLLGELSMLPCYTAQAACVLTGLASACMAQRALLPTIQIE